jgi:hypothetical protein
MAPADDSTIYLDLMRFKPVGVSPNAWAVNAGVSRTVWADMRRHGNPSRRTLEKLLTAAGSSLAEFEALRIGDARVATAAGHPGVGEAARRGWAPAPLPSLPLLDSRLAGEWGDHGSGIELMKIDGHEELERLHRPKSLAADPKAYAVTIVGDSMGPRFRPGRRVAVSPRSPVAVGDDVLVRLRRGTGDLAVLKELVKRTGAFIELRQFNPQITFRMDSDEVNAIDKVAGELF